MKPSSYAQRETGNRSEHKLARCLLIWHLQETGKMPSTKIQLAIMLGVSRFTIDRDLATIESARIRMGEND